ncbi:methyltransferase [Halomonas campisalis]|uniref:Methyltransferase n=1 Tax=Billgrantia campisalis TaxID=74661 RepID=A0ABS9PC61_9GAMM|nr:rRNA adenine N-6-methyltransferase family protein [Halomonas campisalis]MCG6659363.1 methyltransferase [Halomonas campisalis]MDR5863965.1 rRNA adenine N-6-methyltransferase family protein [Halomonas campisalis]
MTAQDRPKAVAGPQRRAQLSLFARNFFKHPKMLGSIIPSSPFLVRRLLDRIDWERARVVVEFGPGVGTITRELLRRMPPDSTLLVLETNQDFVEFLEQSLPDPRLQVVKGSAESVQAELERLGLPPADYVLAGIPFSTMPEDVRERILSGSVDALSPAGSMLIYQFSSRVLPDLRRVFSAVETDFEPLNILPARLYYCSP